MRAAVLALLVSSSLAGCAARSAPPAPPPSSTPVTEQDVQQEFQPDRPDVANATHTVPTGLLQLEMGGQYSEAQPGAHSVGTPLSARLGLKDWLEARVETDGLDYQSQGTHSFASLAGLRVGAKLRLWSTPGGMPVLGIIPAINLPVGEQKGTDYSLTLITGTDFLERNHVDFNYGISSLFTGTARLLQQWVAVSVSRQVTDDLSPYLETYYYNRQDPNGGAVVSSDFGVIWTLRERLAVDGGVDLGVTSSASRYTVFGGVSIVVGEIIGHHGVHERLREAAILHHSGR